MANLVKVNLSQKPEFQESTAQNSPNVCVSKKQQNFMTSRKTSSNIINVFLDNQDRGKSKEQKGATDRPAERNPKTSVNNFINAKVNGSAGKNPAANTNNQSNQNLNGNLGFTTSRGSTPQKKYGDFLDNIISTNREYKKNLKSGQQDYAESQNLLKKGMLQKFLKKQY